MISYTYVFLVMLSFPLDIFIVNVNGYVAYKDFHLIFITLLFQTFNNIV